MSKQERGISPAKLASRERRGRLPYRDIIRGRDILLKENGLEIAHEITHTFIIDQEGKARIFRELRGELVMHSFDSLPQALDQVERVIQHKLGFQRRIGKVFLDIEGESRELVRIGSMLLWGADRYYELPLDLRKAYSESLVEKTIPYLENKRNVYKRAAAEVLKRILESDDEFKDDANSLIQAGKNAFDAAISGIRIVNGETVRLEDGQIHFEDWGSKSKKIYRQLARYYKQLGTLNESVKKGKGQKERKQFAVKLAGKFKEGGSFWEAIGEIKANPFFERFNSRPIKRLTYLPYALTTKRLGIAERMLANAVIELSAVERDFERGRIRLLQPKSTSRP